jgi:hypothetical protein
VVAVVTDELVVYNPEPHRYKPFVVVVLEPPITVLVRPMNMFILHGSGGKDWRCTLPDTIEAVV